MREMYKLHNPEEIKSFEDINSLIKKLKNGIMNNNETNYVILEIDRSIETLQYIDANLSNISLLHIFFFFFTLFIIIIILFSRLLYTKYIKAENKEQQSNLFSRSIIMAQENERKRIAQEFHDTIAQDLWRLSFQIKNEKVVEEQREIIKRIRNICEILIPPYFQRRGLLNAIKKLTFDFEQNSKIKCHLTIQDGLNLAEIDNDTQLQCFRIVQECLSNIEKHSRAAEVLIFVRKQENNTLMICITDNGKGFIPPDKDTCHLLRGEGHFGIWNMYERASSISATLTIESDIKYESEIGTVIKLLVPFSLGSNS